MIHDRRVGIWLAVLGSLSVYLIPLVGPHASWFLGEELFREVTRDSNQGPWWIAANVGLALGVQFVAALILLWALRGRWVRLLVLVPAFLIVVRPLNMAYLVTIPSWFLIEADKAPEQRTWVEHCGVPHVSLMHIRMPADSSTRRIREWWIQGSEARSALMRVPGCEVVDPRLPQPTLQAGGRVDFTLGLQFAVPGGYAIAERWDVATSSRSWWLLREPGLSSIAVSQRIEGAPILASAGDAVAWLEAVEGSGPPVLERVRIHRLEPHRSGDDTVIELAPFGAASYTLLDVDSSAEEVGLWWNDGPLLVGFAGDRRPAPLPTGALRPQASTYQRRGDGWLAWDAYKDEDAYEIAWSLAAGSGRHRLAKGRSITSAAIDPSGTLIAVSATTTLSIGNAPEVVFVLRAKDGAGVFRAYISRYSRSPVAFFEGGFFGYSDERGVHVLKMPDGSS